MNKKSQKLVDKVFVCAEGGRGGDGCVSFRREKFKPRGRPSGGDGGDGGNVVLVGSKSISTLLDVSKKRRIKAENGKRGGPDEMKGARGKHLVIMVPCGTTIRDEGGNVFADIVHPGQEYVLVRGGLGGKGNAYLSHATGKRVSFAEKGEPGEKGKFFLELKLIADVSIVGFPNAGKSTLLSRLTSAKPKIASYPFTTVTPNLGAVEGSEIDFVIADVPGLIDGAHAGKGMGHEFLRHIERSLVVLYLVDMSPGTGRNPADELASLVSELEVYNPDLAKRPCLVAANKMDIVSDEEALDALRAECKKRGFTLYPVSALVGSGLSELRSALETAVIRERELKVRYSEPRRFGISEGEDSVQVEKHEGRFIVKGKEVERMVEMTDWDSDEARNYLARRLKRAGVDEMLKNAGAVDGDEVWIAGRTFNFFSGDEEIGRKKSK